MTDNEETKWSKIKVTQTVDNLIKYGPGIELTVSAIPDGGARTRPILAQIDTGAAGTGISPVLVQQLNLVPIDRGYIVEAGREKIGVNFYRVRLIMPFADVEVDVAGLPSLAPPHHVLIGRDILANSRLVVDFTSGVVLLHVRES